MKISRGLRIAIPVVVICLALAGAWFYSAVYSPNTVFTEESRIVYIRESLPLEQWLESSTADSLIDNKTSLRTVAGWKRMSQVKAGRYRFRRGAGNNAIINMLRSGNQEAITIRIDDTHSIYELAGRLGRHLRSDSAAFISTFTNEEICDSHGFNSTTIACMIAPDTYQFLWTMTPDEFLARMNRIFAAYWTDTRKQQAAKQGLDETSATILASIVKAECKRRDEAPKIAALYLNRLRINMPLQADPTAVFAAGLRGVDRVVGLTHIESAYNTYQNTGLPPGPIDFTEPAYIDAVLLPANHNFLYMCAQPGLTGYHNFSRTYEQHLVYAREYWTWLNKKGIR